MPNLMRYKHLKRTFAMTKRKGSQKSKLTQPFRELCKDHSKLNTSRRKALTG